MIQTKEFERVGGRETIKSNVRIIVATNKNLEEAIKTGIFREDLYYRINVFPIFLPPLRERKDDIMLLADHFLEKFAKENSKSYYAHLNACDRNAYKLSLAGQCPRA